MKHKETTDKVSDWTEQNVHKLAAVEVSAEDAVLVQGRVLNTIRRGDVLVQHAHQQNG